MTLPFWIIERPIAHRGLFDPAHGIPENSLAAVCAARDAGYPMELDLRAIAGGVAVFHDSRLARMTGRDGTVTDATPADLRDLHLSGTAERIPLLDDVLAAVQGRVPLMLEIKNDGRAGRIEAAVIERLAAYRGDVAIVSFNPLSLGWFARHAPHIPRGQTASSFKGWEIPRWRRFLQRNLLLDTLSRPNFLVYELHALPYWAVSWRRKLGMKVITYTVRSESDAIRAHAVADNFIFEKIRP